MYKVTHLTSVHTRYDTRIFVKQCKSLSKFGFQVHLIVSDTLPSELKDGVSIINIGKSTSRLGRMLKTTNLIFKKAIELDSDVYHIHDPELIPTGLKLLNKGYKVVFDAHEDLPLQLLSKPYLNKFSRRVISKLVSFFESYSAKKFSAIITATPFIRDKFLKYNANSVDINNYPNLHEFNNIIPSFENNSVCYVGGISEVRGIKEVIQSLEILTNVKLNLAGSFNSNSLEIQCKEMPGWTMVNELGFLDRSGVMEVYNNSIAGLVTLYPIPNYLDALPVKLFEYMAAGIPVISSNIPLWQSIVDESNSGVCVNPKDPESIAEAITFLISNKELAHKMGQNGQKAVKEKYNWTIEEQKLIALYEEILEIK